MRVVILEIYARETGLNKATASKACALSLIRQLYHAKVIGAFSTAKKNSSETTPFAVVLHPDIEDDLDRVIYDLSLRPVVRAFFLYFCQFVLGPLIK